MASSSSSGSSSTGSSSSTSASHDKEGFTFNGSVYPTYQEMVDAKRERNRKALEKSVDELSSVLGSDYKASSKKSDNSSRQSNSNKNKRNTHRRGGSNQSTGGSSSVQSPRRNPKRTARGTTSSISSQSHVSSHQSSSRRSRKKRRARADNIPIPDIPDGQTEFRESCPQIGPGWEMRVRARKRKTIWSSSKPAPTVDRVFIAPNGRIVRSLNDVDRFLEGESIISGNDTDAISSIGDATASIFSTSRSRRTSASATNSLQQSSVSKQRLAARTSAGDDIQSEEQRKMPTPTGSAHHKMAGPSSSTLPEYIIVKDMLESIEPILLNGGRVQAREAIWKEFTESDSVLGSGDDDRTKTAHGKKNAGKGNISINKDEVIEITTTKESLIHHSDSKLYNTILFGRSGNQLDGAGKCSHDDDKVKNDRSDFGSFGFDDDDNDDIEIPEEFLVANGSISNDPTQQHLEMLQEASLPLDNPVKYNNMVRERNSHYISKGPDRHWDEEFGDGIDPMMFVEECCRGNANANHEDEIETLGDGKKDHKKYGEGNSIAKQYTSSLLQRCWDRAVHAASSLVPTSPTDVHRKESTPPLDAKDKIGDGGTTGTTTTVLQNKSIANSVLHDEATSVVDSLLDSLFLQNNDLRRMLDGDASTQTEKKLIEWRHVLKCLQVAVEQEEKIKQKDATSCPAIPLTKISLKALSMRLIERYGTGSHKMPR